MALELRHKYNILNKLYQEISEKGIQNLTIKDIVDVRQGWVPAQSVLINFVNEIAKEYPPHIEENINKILDGKKVIDDKEYIKIIKEMYYELDTFKKKRGGEVPFGVNHAENSWFSSNEKKEPIKNILNLLIEFMNSIEGNKGVQIENPKTLASEGLENKKFEEFEELGDGPTGGKRKKSKVVTLKTPYLRGKTKKPRKYRRKTYKK
tara:strand:+ start:2341 stop:2961 length:621 start_codon:yes stop_codon:yes gene_type:complete